jgi:leader peptidase (prepilin peptidase)/N-methyltransferase
MQSSVWPVTTLPYWLMILIAAPFVGSFLGVLIRRLPEGRTVGLDRSTCERCGVTLAAHELVPVASFVWQRGRCRHCGEAFGSFHLAIELAAIGVALWAILGDADPDRLWADCLLGWTLLALAWIDWRWMVLPDVLTLPLLLSGLLLTLLLQPDAITNHAAGAAVGYLLLRGVAWSYRLVRGREGMGAGDAKLLGAAGAWLGLTPLPLVVLLAALLGLATAGLLALCGRDVRATTALPFGPCLALALWLIWLHGTWMINGGAVSWSG